MATALDPAIALVGQALNELHAVNGSQNPQQQIIQLQADLATANQLVQTRTNERDALQTRLTSATAKMNALTTDQTDDAAQRAAILQDLQGP